MYEPALSLPALEPRPRRARGPRRVLVVRLSAMGDVLHALPAVHAWTSLDRRVRVDWLVEDRAAALLAGHPSIARVQVVPRTRWRRALRRPLEWPALVREAVGLAWRLLRRRYDVAVDLQGNLKSGAWSLLSGAPVRMGLASDEAREANGFFVNRRVRVPRTVRHRVERSMRLLSVVARARLPFLGSGPAVEGTAPASDGSPRWVDDALARHGVAGAFAALHPGTSRFGAFKRWPVERWAALADRIARETRVAVVVTGSPDETALVEGVRARATTSPVALVTPDLAALREVLARARVLVAADTGPLHLAAAVGTPVLGLFGPKDESVYGPYGRRADGTAGPLPVVTRDDVPCRPCTLRWCPEPICMDSIEDADVFDRIRSLLVAPPAGGESSTDPRRRESLSL